jgi:hypothetical protein
MARTFKKIKIEDKELFVLFDTGSFRSYIKKDFASNVRQKVPPFKVGLGGYSFEIDESCLLNCEIEGLGFDIKAHPIEKIGNERGREIDAIIGATAMEEWGLIPDPRTGKIDLTVLRKREFMEFMEEKK